MQFQCNPRIEIAPLDNELILFDPPSSKFLVLNATGSYLWERLSEPQSADDLARAVCGRFSGVQWTTALKDVSEILEELVSHDLVVRSGSDSLSLREEKLP